ncbi:MAG: hypothetical protein U0270_11530 [Labilithrix sp.]
MTASSLFRTALTSAFVLLMLASGHLFMVLINAAEVAVSAPAASDGVPARMFTDRPMSEEIEAAIKKAKSPEKTQVLSETLAVVESGKPLELRTLPVTRFLVYATLGLTVLGCLLLWSTSRIKGDTAQSIVGIFGGSLLWTGGVEYGLTIAARSLGIGKTVGVVNGHTVAIYGEYVLLKHTWGILVLVMAYLLFLESSRCPVFLWWRKNVPTMRGAVVTGRIDNYGPRSAFQYATTVWGFYLLLLWAYDEHVFGVYSFATKAVMVLSIAGALYTTYRLYMQPGWGAAVRYAVAAMIVVWTPIEIAGKWGLFREPWLLLRPEALLVFFGGLALGTSALWRAQRRTAAARESIALVAAASTPPATAILAEVVASPAVARCPMGLGQKRVDENMNTATA